MRFVRALADFQTDKNEAGQHGHGRDDLRYECILPKPLFQSRFSFLQRIRIAMHYPATDEGQQ